MALTTALVYYGVKRMMATGDKTGRFVASLDAARTNAAWHEVPELIKKAKKHGSHSTALLNVATAEHYTAVETSRKTTDSKAIFSPLQSLLNDLSSVSEVDGEYVLQAKACLLWANWLKILGESESTTLKASFVDFLQQLQDKDTTTWTKICLVRGAYIEGTTLVQQKRQAEARRLYTLAVDLIQANQDLVYATPQLSYWSEQLLAQLALITTKDDSLDDQAAAVFSQQVFRHWFAIISKSNEVLATKFGNSSAHLSRSLVWVKYYENLSLLIATESGRWTPSSSEERQQLVTELLKVQGLYESELMARHKFPSASESNASMEEWVERVIKNWRLICGPLWRENELGDGGRNAIGRTVLDILYRAATKTFHSTLILRRLFQVHKAVAEFDLAYRSLDIYIELVERAKARAAKSNEPDIGIESTEQFLLTISEGIVGLCAFGRKGEARRAYDLCRKLEEWLSKVGIEQRAETQLNGGVLHTHVAQTRAASPRALEAIYRSIGAGTANWARWTPLSENRTQLQEHAVESLRKACSQVPGSDIQVDTHYASALVLAETREVPEAISHAKRALDKIVLTSSEDQYWDTTRKAVALWHLLALLLSSRHEFDSAAKSCSAAFEQFPPSATLIGTRQKTSSIVAEKPGSFAKLGLVNDMECGELQTLIETRITELALIELRDGPDEAVNCCNSLLGVFFQLFGHLDLDPPATKATAASPYAGTIKSTKGSILSRRKHRFSAAPSIQKTGDDTSVVTSNHRPPTQSTQAPTIQITDEHGKAPHSRRHRIRDSLEKKVHGSRVSLEIPKKLVRKSSQRSARNSVQPEVAVGASTTVTHDHSHEPKQQLPEVQHNLASHGQVPLPASHDEQPPKQDVRLPNVHNSTSATSPTPRFSKIAAQKHALTILTKIWLVIATLYRRASMFEDSREACEEASKTVATIEALVSSVDYSARAFAQVEWGGSGRSVDEVWADVYYERAELQLAIHERRLAEGQDASIDGLHKAIEHYEQCLMLSPDHTNGIIGLSNILLDFYERKVELASGFKAKGQLGSGPSTGIHSLAASAGPALALNGGASETQSLADAIPGQFEVPAFLPGSQFNGTVRSTQTSARPSLSASDAPRWSKADDSLRKTPENLNRIAARDRAYGLLSTLTKLGSGWDSSEAWYALARAHELSGEFEKAKSILWWCVELEDSRPIRHWRNLGYSLD